jgi:hypothetical protein
MAAEENGNSGGSQQDNQAAVEGTVASTGISESSGAASNKEPGIDGSLAQHTTDPIECLAGQASAVPGTSTVNGPGDGIPIEGELRPAPRQVSEAELKQLRRLYFTVRHDTVQPCGHKLDRVNQPDNNCEFCWFGFYESHPQLVETADKAYVEQGQRFLDKMRGVKFRKFFTRYMATKLKMQQEMETKNG